MEDIREESVGTSATQSKITTKVAVFPYISWAAIFAGLAVGVASHMLLTLFSVAAGLSVANTRTTEPGQIPVLVATWNAISMLISAFIGGYVAARMSGLSRRVDGMLHGFVAWGVTTLLFAFLATTTLGPVIGSAYGVVKDTISNPVNNPARNFQVALETQDNNARLEALIKDSIQHNRATGGNSSEIAELNTSAINNLRNALENEDSQLAVEILINQMGFTQDQAIQIANRAQLLFLNSAITDVQERSAIDTVDALTIGSWWFFLGTLISMIVGIIGGAMGANATSRRRLQDYKIAS